MIFLDSETCGLHSQMVLLQYAEDDGPIRLYDVWKRPVGETLELIEWMTTQPICGFNLSFDHFHICKLYTIWRLLPESWIPEQHIEEIALAEPYGQTGPCVKPVSACDLLLWSRKNQYQALMSRGDIRIRRVPTALAYALAQELEKRVEIDGIYFARSKDPNAPKWKVYEIKRNGRIVEDFRDVVLKFKPAGGLKFLAEYALGYTPKFHYSDVEIDESLRPIEKGYAPTALAVSRPEKGWRAVKKTKSKSKKTGKIKESIREGFAWPGVIQAHIDHWATNEPAREYAKDDIVYTRELYKHFGSPEPGDDDSTLACAVAAVRWHGFEINVPGIRDLRNTAKEKLDKAPININKPAEVRQYLGEVMDEIESLIIEETTKKEKLKEIAEWKDDDDNTHPAAIRAQEILDIKYAKKEVELFDRLLDAGKFHPSFVVIGALSSRMSGSGADGLNAQGIKKTKEVRSQFPLAWKDYVLCGGDFDSFEVTLADAVYNDPQLRASLKSGRKLHGLFGMAMYPGQSYEEILASEGTKNDMYTKAKSGVFAMIYGGNALTLHRNLGIPMDVAEAAYAAWGKMFPGIERARIRIYDQFCSMRQPGGLGTQVVWSEPQDYVESFLGDRRYFTLENRICKELFDLANKPPKAWRDSKVKVVRRDKVQTASGAVQSALYGAAFALQQANMRAAANHEIQSPGARITKYTQRKIWDVQPAGIHEWHVATMNIHDEVLCVTRPDMVDHVAEAVGESVEHFRPHVALIGMKWNLAMESWAEKKGGAKTLHFTPHENKSTTETTVGI
jgi:hypothetical protein